MDTLINQIDHILIQQKYTKEIFVTMSEILDLPIAWDIKSYGGLFVSGGICFGNINIEILNYARLLRILGVAPNKDGIIGIAFEPCNSVEYTSKILDKIGVHHGKPKPFNIKVAGEKKNLWTNLFLKGILSKFQMFFCKYSFNVDERRNRFNNQLIERNGGLLGVEYIKEITIGYSDDETLNLWKKLSQKEYGYSNCCISFKNGPVINLVKSKKDSILSILVKVKSIERAKEMLSKKQQITLNDNNEIIIELKKECNLGLKLCE